ncbi:MAG: biotin carboxylase N-terminal domain-containing protein [Myxococcota bacterium]|nr:biotin carboxylase N-terminal domain-containing protein [Myxococcota bacterium]
MSFTTLLVANRGEIARRVIRSAQDMGVRCVAVYVDADTGAPFVGEADEAVRLENSYLDAPGLLEAARATGAGAVHPGYGFLSENAGFASDVIEAGLAWVGPAPEAIEEMGDKLAARALAEQAQVPTLPGTDDPAAAASIGYPLLVKAAAGGGGKGMRVVESPDALEESLAAASREAKSGFGDDRVFLERCVSRARHIEIQILGDTHGNLVHLGERECSIQRRHQKILEESPAPRADAALRKAMGEAALRLARALGYRSAGTVEFLLDEETGEFFFLEVNTRLQVEHPVTELVTGVDLVEQQLLVASGESLSFAQDDIEVSGHAIEVRINAEDPAEGAFLPSPGRIERLKVPDGYGIRFDAGYESGDEVSQFYDNLIGKLIVWGRDRDTAIQRTVRALDEMVVEGVATTIPADRAILEHADFRAVAHSTKWVEETLDLTGVRSPSTATGDEQPTIRRDLGVEVDGRRFSVSMWVPDQAAAVARRRSSRSGGRGGSGDGNVTVPMQGTIVKVLVVAGDTVAVGDTVCVLEAMKMENNITAEASGTVIEVRVEPGDSVGSGDIVAVVE